MKRFIIAATLAVLAASGCTKGEQGGVSSNTIDKPANEAVPATNTVEAAPPQPGTRGGLPDDRTPLSEPKGAIDPKSAEAAGQVMQSYGALIEQKRWKEASALWDEPANGVQYGNTLKDYTEVHLNIGKPGELEGAAGSSYVTVPIVFYGTTHGGAPFKCPADATLRRVNDVPGSTERQRRWHIWTIEC